MIEIFDEKCALMMAEILIRCNIAYTMEHIKENGLNGYRFNWSQDRK